MAEIVVRQALTLEGIAYGPGSAIPLEVWLRPPERERNKFLNLGKVKRVENRTTGPGRLARPFRCGSVDRATSWG